MKRLSQDSYGYYVELGQERSYEAVARRYGVSKITVVRHAEKHRWQERLREAERKAREEDDRKAIDTLKAVKERQLQEARILERRALEALKALPPEKAGKAAAMLNIAWKHELLLLGEPSQRTEVSVEEITKREIATLLIHGEEQPSEPEPEEPDDDDEAE